MLSTAAIADVTPAQLAQYASLIYDKIGVTISPQKSTLLSNRLRRRLRATGLGSYNDYYQMLLATAVDEPEWQAFLQEVTTHETYLYRDEHHWLWFRDVFLKQMQDQAKAGKRLKTLRIWSAACSSGDEAATAACCIAEGLPDFADWRIEIFGTDIGADAVAHAAEAVFGARAMRCVDPKIKHRCFKALPGGDFALKPQFKSLLKFKVHNLLHPLNERPFDLVFLKNVLIYFDKASKRRVIESLRASIRPGSYLVTGASEGVTDLLKDFQSSQVWLHCYAPGRI